MNPFFRTRVEEFVVMAWIWVLRGVGLVGCVRECVEVSVALFFRLLKKLLTGYFFGKFGFISSVHHLCTTRF